MADSSTDPVVTDAASATAPVVQAEATPAKEPSILDAVEKALSDTGVEAASPAAEPIAKADATTQDKPSESPKDSEVPDEELKKYSPGAQARIRELAAQKNDLRSQLDNLQNSPEHVALKDKAESFDKLTGFLGRHGISSQEANNALETTRLIKSGDYSNALKLVEPIYHELQKRAGGVLDADLQEDVRLGHVPIERAQELQRLRASEKQVQTQQQIQESRQTTQRETEANRKFVMDIATAADNWAKQKASSDPDWEKKQDQVAELVDLDLRKNGFPRTAEEALQRSEAALERVNKRWGSLRGTPQEIRPNVGGRQASTRADQAPKSALEAIEQALG